VTVGAVPDSVTLPAPGVIVVPPPPPAASSIEMIEMAEVPPDVPDRLNDGSNDDVLDGRYFATPCVQYDETVPCEYSSDPVGVDALTEYAPSLPVLFDTATSTTSAACASPPLAIVNG
jgi:hypothetical protein